MTKLYAIYMLMAACCVLAFLIGFIASWLYFRKKPSGTIIIEKGTGEENDLLRFDFAIDLDEIETKDKLIFDVKVEQP